jgi:hypothetical protein
MFEALKLFRAEVDKRKRKRRMSKTKAALSGDLLTYQRLHDGSLYSASDSDDDDPTFRSEGLTGRQSVFVPSSLLQVQQTTAASTHDPHDVDPSQEHQHEHDQATLAPPTDQHPVLIQMPTGEVHLSPMLVTLLKKAKEEDLEIFLKFLSHRQRAEVALLEKQAQLRREEMEAEFRSKAQLQQAEAELRLAHDMKMQEMELRKREEEVKLAEMDARKREADNDAKRLELQILQAKATATTLQNAGEQ